MAEAYIVEAVRTAGGRRNGRLSGIHANDLGALSLNAIVDRTGIDPAAIEDVIFGCVTQAGEQSLHVGRNCVLASKLPRERARRHHRPPVRIVAAGDPLRRAGGDVGDAGHGDRGRRREHEPRADGHRRRCPAPGPNPMRGAVLDRFGVKGFSQFTGAEMIAKKYGFSREMLDQFGYESHRKAIAATQAGAFEREIVSVPVTLADGTSEVHTKDEGIRYEASPETMATVKLLVEGGVITAATSSQITDGSSRDADRVRTRAQGAQPHARSRGS